ncbi:MAG: CBS domain-containing protein [Bacteroidota bacterium]|nr:CBS domain-containing protein [Bacteroidota bacterium]
MLASTLIQKDYPVINLTDKVALVLQWMEDYEVQHLPVQSEEKYVGLVSKDDLLDTDEESTIAVLQHLFIQQAVKPDTFFMLAVQQLLQEQLSLVVVVNDQYGIEGVLTAGQLLKQLATFTGVEEPGGFIILELDKRNYSFGEISRLVETNDAYITQLNTYTEPETGLVLVTVKINKKEISDILSTFQRYDYVVRYYVGEEQYTNELKENYNLLMTYLNM